MLLLVHEPACTAVCHTHTHIHTLCFSAPHIHVVGDLLEKDMLKQAAEANVQDDEVEGSRMRLYMKYPIISTYT